MRRNSWFHLSAFGRKSSPTGKSARASHKQERVLKNNSRSRKGRGLLKPELPEVALGGGSRVVFLDAAGR